LKETDMENDQDKLLGEVTSGEYKYGFVTDIETDVIPKGLSEDVVRLISSKKEEPDGCSSFASRHSATGRR
jgi:Fe-S cluster assembly protein SufB